MAEIKSLNELHQQITELVAKIYHLGAKDAKVSIPAGSAFVSYKIVFESSFNGCKTTHEGIYDMQNRRMMEDHVKQLSRIVLDRVSKSANKYSAAAQLST